MRTPSGPTKSVHYREGVLWSGVYYTLCGLYLGFSKCPLQREEGCPLRGVPLLLLNKNKISILRQQALLSIVFSSTGAIKMIHYEPSITCGCMFLSLC